MSTVEEIAALVREARVVQRELESLDTQAKAAKKALAELLERRLPDAFAAADMSEFRTTDGKVVKVEPFVDCSIPVASRPEAFQWLRDNGHDGILKCEVSVEFGAGNIEHARTLQAALIADNVPASLAETVHPMTLKRFARELMEQGESLPESFSVYTGTRATIK